MSERGLEALRRGLLWRRRWRCWQEALGRAVDGDWHAVKEGEVGDDAFEEARASLRCQLRALLEDSIALEMELGSAAGLSAAFLSLSDMLKKGRGPRPEQDIGRSGSTVRLEEKQGNIF